MKVIITGGCGFVGHHFVEHFIKNTDWEIIVFDKLTYAANGYDRLRDISVFDSKRIKLFSVDLNQEISIGVIKVFLAVVSIVHLAAESHVDNSIAVPVPFVLSNVKSTVNMLEYARSMPNLKAFNMFSTDEVFGPAPKGVAYKEWDRYHSGNPYSASKAASEEMALAWANTYRIPLFITHTMNVMGERQHPEKFIPLCIRKILNGEEIKIHANPTKTASGVRSYIHARNVAAGVHFLLDNFKQSDKYNIVGEKEISNEALALMIGEILGKKVNYELVDFHSSRPGHDLRYALDGSKMKEIGWAPKVDFEKSLEKIVQWFLSNKKWLDI